MEKQSWEEIQAKHQDQWILLDEWDEDECGDIISGHVIFHSTDRDEISKLISKKFKKVHLAIRYTGDVRGPFFIQ